MAGLAGALAAAGLALAAAPAHADVVWLCKPGLADNPCEIPQDTTLQRESGADTVFTPPQRRRKVDCFYVYPTVSNQLSQNADKSRDPELESIAKYQAARFSLRCRVFAPIYRQITLFALGTGSGGDRALAYGDVLEAWREYVRRENRGRGVVLIGHSQGTFMLRELLRSEIERKPAQRRLLVSALLLGGDVTVADGRATGGDFRRTPICTREAQVGCVAAYSTFAEDPPEDARYGTAEPGMEIACTDPRKLSGRSAPLRPLMPSEPFATGPIAAGFAFTYGGPPPSAETTWVAPPDRYDAACRKINGAHVLRLEPRPGSERPMWFPEPSWGTHLIDVNIGLDPLLVLAARQSRRWSDPRLRLARRCAGGKLVASIRGRDAEFVRRAVFKLGRHRATRSRRGGLRAVFGRRALRTSQAHAVRAVAHLRFGEPRRLVLQRRLPRCATG